MTTIIDILRLLYPFLQEFGLNEINLRKFITSNKPLSYMFLMCLIMFVLFGYALEQAHLRMIDNVELVKVQTATDVELNTCMTTVGQLNLICNVNVVDGYVEKEQTLDEILGIKDGK